MYEERSYTKRLVFGIYAYVEIESSNVVYIGKDANITVHERHKNHLKPSKKGDQLINTKLQDDEQKYAYVVLATFREKELMDLAEVTFINKHRPKYNVAMKNSKIKDWRKNTPEESVSE